MTRGVYERSAETRATLSARHWTKRPDAAIIKAKIDEKVYSPRRGQSTFYLHNEQEPDGVCSICGKLAKLVQDHDHQTQRLRDRICNRCNCGIGMLLDSPDALRRAAEYIEQYRVEAA